ncbi:monovalent cation/H(+) antiporter subunit G [Arthrobacter cryoconiti]|uniref:Monovalent cation/H(+) antiporter subunit G n=1 Tax=Arthrobacter cryoconiti TaxID=748907 RepID=A0ABV8R209_9MICC|nr:monovalent cation/H(+) antiporter subunit G [Arthrobacter cryoconiti]MCC9067961.1 monovalent cation/H(+) antiporter subunit G [Arthrobacter cryoconiti]
MSVIDILSAIALLGGALMSLAAAVGLLRFPDLMSRMHAATKPQVLGLFLMLVAVGLQMRQWALLPALLVAWLFQLLTVPVSAHMVGRAGYRSKHRRPELLSTDDLHSVVEAVVDGGAVIDGGGGAAKAAPTSAPTMNPDH